MATAGPEVIPIQELGVQRPILIFQDPKPVLRWNLTSQEREEIDLPSSLPKVAPDGRWLAWVRNVESDTGEAGEYCIYDRQKGESCRLRSRHGAFGENLQVLFSATGGRLAVAEDQGRYAKRAPDAPALRVLVCETGEERGFQDPEPVPEETFANLYPRWSEDDRVVFVERRSFVRDGRTAHVHQLSERHFMLDTESGVCTRVECLGKDAMGVPQFSQDIAGVARDQANLWQHPQGCCILSEARSPDGRWTARVESQRKNEELVLESRDGRRSRIPCGESGVTLLGWMESANIVYQMDSTYIYNVDRGVAAVLFEGEPPTLSYCW